MDLRLARRFPKYRHVLGHTRQNDLKGPSPAKDGTGSQTKLKRSAGASPPGSSPKASLAVCAPAKPQKGSAEKRVANPDLGRPSTLPATEHRSSPKVWQSRLQRTRTPSEASLLCTHFHQLGSATRTMSPGQTIGRPPSSSAIHDTDRADDAVGHLGQPH